MKTISAAARVRALRESEALFRAILNTVVDAVITIDAAGVIRAFNPAAERMFGYPSAEIIGRKLKRLMPAPHAEHHEDYIDRYLRTGRAHLVGVGREVTGRRRDGTLFPIDLAVSEVRRGRLRLFTGVARDITDRKRIEREITEISEAERRRFGRELHDGLGQQLTGLSLLAKALEHRLAAHDKADRAQAAGIAALASRILDEVKLQTHGLYPIELEKRGLNAALRELVDMKKRLFHVGCTYRCSADVPPLRTPSALHVYRIAQEAMSNAIKHGCAKRICVELRKDASVMKLTVTDNGCGIPEDAAARGGMGLSIMRYRAHALGAHIDFRRGAKVGSVVTCAWSLAVLQQNGSGEGNIHGRKRQNATQQNPRARR